jgi:hypothetical protein
MGENVVHMLSSEEHPLSDENIMVSVFVDIKMTLEARNTHVKSFILPMPSEEEMREVEEIDTIARRRRLPTVRRLQLSGDLEHSRTCVDKSINVDENGNFKLKNGQKSVSYTLTEDTDDEARHIRACFISAVGGSGNTSILNTLLNAVRSIWVH